MDKGLPADGLKKAEYRSKYEDIKSINKEQRQWIRDRETRLEQLISYYIISQIGILLSISSSSAILRKDRWIPFSLLSLVSILFWLQITATIFELLLYEYDVRFMKQLIMAENGKIQKQTDGGGGRVSSGDYSSKNKRLFLKPDKKETLYRRYAYVSAALALLLAFTVVVFSASHVILLGGDQIL